jgi:hypothetical protein
MPTLHEVLIAWKLGRVARRIESSAKLSVRLFPTLLGDCIAPDRRQAKPAAKLSSGRHARASRWHSWRSSICRGFRRFQEYKR